MLVGFWDDAINVCTIFYLQSLTSSSLLGFCSFSILYFQWSSDYFNQLRKRSYDEWLGFMLGGELFQNPKLKMEPLGAAVTS